MSSTTILYEFVFVGVYDETAFMQSPYARDTLRPKVQGAVETEQRFLQRFPRVNKISQQVEDQGQYFKVSLSRSV
jgi:hypothetical protein